MGIVTSLKLSIVVSSVEFYTFIPAFDDIGPFLSSQKSLKKKLYFCVLHGEFVSKLLFLSAGKIIFRCF